MPPAIAPPLLVPEIQISRSAAVEIAETSDRAWLICSVIILLAAAAVRFYALELKPLHHDEGVNGFFMTNLVRQGVYKYDPTNYHGPTLYYLALPTTVLFGLGTFALRSLTVLFGIGTVWLILSLRRQLGSIATLTAAMLIAISPAAVYYSRYFIHETLFAFFALGIVVAAVRFYETGRTVFIAAGGISAALLFATKETAFVSVITLVLAWIFVEIWQRKLAGAHIQGASKQKRNHTSKNGLEFNYQQILKKVGDDQRLRLVVAGSIVIFVGINVLFYSSFFSNAKGVNDAISALAVWSKTGTSEFHGKPFDTYLKWLIAEEAPILVLAIVGSLIALFERRLSRFAIFAGAWGFGMLAAYSFIPYKTPWLMLNFIVPMAIIGGYAVPAIATRFNFAKNALTSALLITGVVVGICAYQSLVLNFREYDNDAYPYVYAHSHRELHALVAEVERLTALSGRKELGISVASPEYWPLPWYFRNNQRVGFAGNVAANYDPNDVQLIVGRESDDASQDQTRKLKELVGTKYQHVGSYTLRPGVRLALFAQSQLAR